jgi:hypothetical protein
MNVWNHPNILYRAAEARRPAVPPSRALRSMVSWTASMLSHAAWYAIRNGVPIDRPCRARTIAPAAAARSHRAACAAAMLPVDQPAAAAVRGWQARTEREEQMKLRREKAGAAASAGLAKGIAPLGECSELWY